MTPNLQSCSDRTFYNWEVILPYVYQTAPGKNLGIWCNYLTPAQCKNYGFNGYFIGTNSDTTALKSTISSLSSIFSPRNLMIGLGCDQTTAMKIIDMSVDVGYYLADEPYESGCYDQGQIQWPLAPELAAKHPNDKLMVTSYTAPQGNLSDAYKQWGVEYYLPLMQQHSNVFIQCDKYTFNCSGNITYYWDLFNSFYGIGYNFSNWMHVVENNGSSPGDWPCSGGTWPNNTDWSTLFGRANAYGMNNIWLYAYGTGNEVAVSNFALAAFQNGFVYNEFQQVVTEWKCVQNNCTSCSYPSVGTWYLYDMYYTHVYTYFGF